MIRDLYKWKVLFRQSLISSSFEEGGYEVTGRLNTSTESLMDNFIENIENLEIRCRR